MVDMCAAYTTVPFYNISRYQQVTALLNNDIVCNIASYATLQQNYYGLQDSDEGSGAAWLQHTRFPTPSSNPRGMQGSAALPLLEAPCFTRAASSGWGLEPRRVSATITSNPWGLQEAALPMLEISHPEGATEAEVTYTPVEELLADVSDIATQHTVSAKCHVLMCLYGVQICWWSSRGGDASCSFLIGSLSQCSTVVKSLSFVWLSLAQSVYRVPCQVPYLCECLLDSQIGLKCAGCWLQQVAKAQVMLCMCRQQGVAQQCLRQTVCLSASLMMLLWQKLLWRSWTCLSVIWSVLGDLTSVPGMAPAAQHSTARQSASAPVRMFKLGRMSAGAPHRMTRQMWLSRQFKLKPHWLAKAHTACAPQQRQPLSCP